MGINLSGVINVARNAITPGLQVLGANQAAQTQANQQKIAGILQQFQMERQLEQDRIANALKGAQMNAANATATYRTHQANQPTRDPVADHAAERKFDIANPITPAKIPSEIPGTPEWEAAQTKLAKIRKQFGAQPQEPLVQVQQPDGSVIYLPRSQAAGQRAPSKLGGIGGTLAAPMAAKVGQFGEMLKKGADLLPSMDALDVSLGQSAASDIAQHGVGVGSLRIPGTQGAGALMVNRTPAYSTYQASLAPFILAAAHALSGARINQDQVAQIKQSIEIKPGDTPQVRAQKKKNVIDLMNSIGGSLPGDAITAQESQMDPSAITQLESYGYRRTKTAPDRVPNAPTGTAPKAAAPKKFGYFSPGGGE